MNYSQKKAKQKYLYDKPDVLTDKQTIKNRKKEISKYNRVVEKEIVKEAYEDYLYSEEYADMFYDDFEAYGGFDEYIIWNEIDLDDLPEGITLDGYRGYRGCKDSCEKSYNETYDSYYCEEHDLWIEDTCKDDNCEFCSDRPERPSDIGIAKKWQKIEEKFIRYMKEK